MKKGLIAILAILYMTITSGVVVNIHYCMGRVASVEYGYDEHDKCGKCGMEGKKQGCCHTDYKLVKVDDAHQLAKVNLAFMQWPAETPVYNLSLLASPVTATRYLTPHYHAPPDQRSNEVYLRNSVFRV